MRLLIVTFDPPENVGGVEGRATAYTRSLLRSGNFVELIALSPSYHYTREEFNGTELGRYPSSTRHLLRSLRSAIRDMKSNSIDSIFLLSGGLTLFGLGLLVYSRITGKRSLVFLYGKDILGTKKNRLARGLLVLASSVSQRVAVNSRFTRSLLPPFIAGKAGILYPGVDPGIAAPYTEAKANARKNVLFVGRLVNRKGADDLIRAFSQLDGAVQDSTLEIVGDGPEKESLRELARSLGVLDRVSFLGTKRGKELYDSYRGAYLLAMPSRTEKGDVEGFGTVFLEAGLFGKPSIGTRSGGIPEAIIQDETGLLVPERDPSALYGALRELLLDEAKAGRLGKNAHDRVTSKFTWDESTRALLGLLRS